MLTWPILLLFWIGPPTTVPQAPTVSQYAAADVTEKLRLLGQVTASRSMALDDLMAIARLAMRDPDPRVRSGAMGIIAARVMASRWAGARGPMVGPAPRGATPAPLPPIVSPEWKDDRRKLIDALYDDVVAILKTDVDPRVRHEALLAVGNLQLIVEGPDLPPDVINLLIDRFREDPDPSIRSEVVKSLRLITSDSPDLRAVLRDALLDPQDSVRLGAQSAIQPHATPHIKLTFAEARGAIETALTSADADRRRAAVQALNNFGRAAREYLPRLQVLAANDPDSRVRESATLAIAAIHRDGG